MWNTQRFLGFLVISGSQNAEFLFKLRFSGMKTSLWEKEGVDALVNDCLVLLLKLRPAELHRRLQQ